MLPHETTYRRSAATRVTLGIAFFVLFVVVWAIATLGGFVSKTFLADPITMVKSGYTGRRDGISERHRHDRVGVVGGFVIAAVLALPLAC